MIHQTTCQCPIRAYLIDQAIGVHYWVYGCCWSDERFLSGLVHVYISLSYLHLDSASSCISGWSVVANREEDHSILCGLSLVAVHSFILWLREVHNLQPYQGVVALSRPTRPGEKQSTWNLDQPSSSLEGQPGQQNPVQLEH